MTIENKTYGIACLLTGLGVGAMLGILYAPKSGRKTREALVNETREGTEYLHNRASRAVNNISKAVDDGKEQVSEFFDRGKSMVADQVGRVTAAVDAGRQAYKG